MKRRPASLNFLLRILIPGFFFCFVHPQVSAELEVNGSIEGRVTDRETGNPIPGANVVIASTTLGAATDSSGRYRIDNVPPGPCTIGVLVIGYEQTQARITVIAWRIVTQDFSLEIQPIQLEGITREAPRAELEKEIQISVQELRGSELALAGTAAQADLFRTIQTLPAVAQASDFSSELYIRGGSPDQNLVLLDGATIYNPFHFTGFFGAFNALGVETAELFAGGYPARYGGRASSVLDIKNKVGDKERYHGRLNVDFLSASGLFEGPMPLGSFCFSARRSFQGYLNRVNQSGIFGTTIPPYRFYDIQGKTVTQLGESHRLILSGYWADDVIKGYEEFRNPDVNRWDLYDAISPDYSRWDRRYGQQKIWAEVDRLVNLILGRQPHFTLDADWGNQAGSATWQYLPSENFSISTVAAASRFFSGISITDNTIYPSAFNFHEEIGDRTAMSNIVWSPVKRVQFRAGAQIKSLTIDYLLKSPEEKLEPQLFPVDPNHVQIRGTRRSRDVSAYLETSLDITENLLVNAGLRYARYEIFANGGPDLFSYNFLKYSHELRHFQPATRQHLEPRLGLKYNPDEDNYFKAAWGAYNQDLFLIPLRSGSNVTVLNLWFPLDGKYQPITANHYIFGYKRYLPLGFSISTEFYYKRLPHFPEQADTYVSDDPSSYFQVGKGRVRGLELLIRRQGANTYGWLGYSFSKASLDLTEETFDLWFDQRHRVNFVLHWFSMDRRWEAVWSWTYNSGLPYTKIIADGLTLDLEGYNETSEIHGLEYLPVNMDGSKHAWRYPAYHRMDMSLKRTLIEEPFELKASVWWVNLYNHQNIFFYRYQGAYTSPGRISMLPSIPFLGLEAEF